jgi:hypothetical protein
MINEDVPLAVFTPEADVVKTLLASNDRNSYYVKSIIVCNTSTSDQTFNLSTGKSAAQDKEGDYLFNDYNVPANDAVIINLYIRLKGGKNLIAKSSGSITFTVIGDE